MTDSITAMRNKWKALKFQVWPIGSDWNGVEENRQINRFIEELLADREGILAGFIATDSYADRLREALLLIARSEGIKRNSPAWHVLMNAIQDYAGRKTDDNQQNKPD